MDNYEKEFEARKTKINEFKEELKALIGKYDFEKDEVDQYNGMGEYCGTDYYFVINGETWYSETISDVVDEIYK